jgi:hypothetical protein
VAKQHPDGPVSESPPAKAPADTKPVEELAKECGIPHWVMAGATVHYEWGAGKEMTESAFRRAITRFLDSPIGGDHG